jgi:tetratricopeptide (TPR) repeat protein
LAYIDKIDAKNETKDFNVKINNVSKHIKLKKLCVTFSAFLILSFIVYYANYKPIKASRLSVRISNSFPLYKSFSRLEDDFNEALSYETFGSTDIKRSMAAASSQIIKNKLFSFEGALDFIQRTAEELIKDMPDNYYNLDYIMHTVNLYYDIARFEPSFINVAEKLIKDCMEINPYYEGLYFRLADVYLLKKDYESAFSIIKKTVGNTRNDRKQLRLAELAILASREDVAVRALEKVENIRRRRNADIYADKKIYYSEHELYMLAKAYREAANYHKALEYFQAIVELFPDNAQYHFEISQIYLKLGDKIKAAIEAKKAAGLDPLNYSGKVKEIY